MEEKSGFLILVSGIVQGVGFRPFVYNLAKKYDLKGYVKNTLKGVEIVVYGRNTDLDDFIKDLKSNPPVLSKIKSITTERFEYKDLDEFYIEKSQSEEEKSIFILPDIGICKKCEEDFNNKQSRFYRYPFITCTDCGPRYSIIKKYPYDRINTTMNEFIMCKDCHDEYRDIESRRFHAETISCFKCGPVYSLFDNNFEEVDSNNIWDYVCDLLKSGKILAVKGIGGYHLILDAKNHDALKILRERKKRDRKPFALLMRDLDVIKEYCFVTGEEEKFLDSPQKPILLLRRKKSIGANTHIDHLIAGSSPYFGVMLPYTPVHFLLTEKFPVLVCTSANVSGEPIIYKDKDLERLRELADYFLIHDREIVRFVEDSVVKVSNIGRRKLNILFRKSRGFAPLPMFFEKGTNKKIVGLGGDLKSTISILNDDVLIQSQYLGDLADYQSYESYKECFDDLQKIFMFTPDFFVCDLHPAYISTTFAEGVSKGKKLFQIQHHKAHIASVMLEKGWIEENVLGIALDGTGYGEDGHIWGGEVFVGNLKKGLSRVGGLQYLPFPFGDRAIKEPERTFLSYFLSSKVNEDRVKKMVVESKNIQNFETLKKIIKNSKIFASSMGRLFDAVSFLLGFRDKVSYEGEPAIELENLVHKYFDVNEFDNTYSINVICEDGRYVVDVKNLLKQIFDDFEKGVENYVISLRFHSAIIKGFCKISKNFLDKYDIKKIALSGGSFHNQFLLYHFFRIFDNEYEVAINEYSPPNDACISVGQCAYFAYRD